MKHSPKIITEACSSYKRGMSLKNVKDHLSEYRETDISRSSVLNWVRKYSSLLTKKTEKFVPNIKGPLHNDEFFVHVKKKLKCRWVSKDRKTKFRLFGRLSDTKEYGTGAKLLFSTIKQRYKNQFLEAKKRGKKIRFVSDKLGHYRKGFKKYFRNLALLTFGLSIKRQRKYD
ncbi:hypothetical protein J4206_07350 [Candidatus Woesearchaeota archaeon]|nr:hypothetical protein [Candidatus Woesearchaeota archaeon]